MHRNNDWILIGALLLLAVLLLSFLVPVDACDKRDNRIVYGNERWVQQQTLYELQKANRIAKRANRIAQRAAQAREREVRRAARWRTPLTDTR